MRVQDLGLLKSYHGLPCLCCEKTEGTVAHHVKTKGSGGSDEVDNLMALCASHHRMVHDLGLAEMAMRFVVVEIWLRDHGWLFDEYMQRWSRMIGEQDGD